MRLNHPSALHTRTHTMAAPMWIDHQPIPIPSQSPQLWRILSSRQRGASAGAPGEGHPSPTAPPASLSSSATSPCPTSLTRASRGESPTRSTSVSCIAARQRCRGQPRWEYPPGILHRMCRLSQGGQWSCSGGGQWSCWGSAGSAAVFVKEVAISLGCDFSWLRQCKSPVPARRRSLSGYGWLNPLQTWCEAVV